MRDLCRWDHSTGRWWHVGDAGGWHIGDAEDKAYHEIPKWISDAIGRELGGNYAICHEEKVEVGNV